MLLRPRRSATLVAVLVLGAAATALTGCSSTETEARAEAASGSAATATTAPSGSSAPTGTSPIVFAFTCTVGDGPEVQTYTTSSAVWQDRRTSCTAAPITGTVPSAQQQSALDAAQGDATLEELAAGCAVSGTGPWRSAVETAEQEHLAAGLERYCPGHPDMARLRDALDAHRG
ncbi:hypothetical protein [Curtobacterium sp. MCPF17_052]|uniref:hypothetical protein n=1 Tax=Curtobacterium sp. MCPF17_052 TaxID=2175655 RepID=UPI000DA735F7|nr:hypothetical protein [Curtobacterium sp. MCPF17_052]WIB12456.1 hypothetical protein DEJ36_17700 [Curtobacterium sp. MCPF17_052]